MRVPLLCLIFAVAAGCDRGPDPAPAEESSDEREPTTSAAAPHAQQERPPGHPPTAPSPVSPKPDDSGELKSAAGGVRWEAPAGFEARRPSKPMRVVEYVVPEKEQGESAATLRVFHFPTGGSVEDNVERWLGQFEPPDGKSRDDVSTVRKREITGLQVTVVDVSGTFRPMQMPGSPSAGPKRNQRMLGAIVDAPEGRVFFKLVGDAPVVSRAKNDFDELLDSLQTT